MTQQRSEFGKDKLTEAGLVSADEYWERIEYFLSRMVPVVAGEKVRMACHPHDPGMPEPAGYRGVHTVLGSPADRISAPTIRPRLLAQ